MNNDPPFNPLLPSDFGVNPQPETELSHSQAEAGTSTHRENTQSRRTTRPRRARHANGNGKKNRWSRWDRIKGQFTARLAAIDQERLKLVLVACGIAVGAAAIVVLAVKLMPVALTILLLLGLGMAIRVWDRLRQFPWHPPF